MINKTLSILIMALLIFPGLVLAAEDFTMAKQLIDSGVNCDNLNDKQLESIGDYYMEQMHPGQAHEFMDSMMGGEGSESLKLIHINMAKRIYCNEDVYVGYGMMGNMMGKGFSRGGGMMGMMGGYYGGYGMGAFGWIFMILIVVALVLLILWLIKQLQNPKRRK